MDGQRTNYQHQKTPVVCLKPPPKPARLAKEFAGNTKCNSALMAPNTTMPPRGDTKQNTPQMGSKTATPPKGNIKLNSPQMPPNTASFSKDNARWNSPQMGSKLALAPKSDTKLNSEMGPKPVKPLKGDRSNLERRLINALECPVCFEYMAPPIFTCPNGHNLCGSCLVKCNEVCPKCDEHIDSRRNLALEQLSESPLYPCSYSSRGCLERLQAQAKLSHESRCAYRPLACPLVCGWRGRRDQLPPHVTLQHPDGYTVVPRDRPHFQHSITQSDCFQDYRHAVFAFGETFAYIRRFSMERRKMHLAVLLLGNPAEASSYWYKFKMAKDDTERYKSMSLTCSVHSYDEGLDTIFIKNSCITLDFETLVFYGNGPRSLKISKSQQVMPCE